MIWLRSSVIVGVVLVLATAAQAARNDLKGCNQSSDPDLTLIGCSRAIDEATRRSPKLASAYLKRGAAYLMKDDLDRALTDLDQAISLDPKTAFVYLSRAEIFSAKGEVDRAITDYTEVINLDPKFARAYFMRSAAFARRGDLGRARTDYDQAVSLDLTLAPLARRP
jgi:Tfp pilus assembly protein PilF